jgi:subtilisin family serine protease
VLAASLATVCAHVAHAQIGGVQLPQLPRAGDLPGVVTGTVNGALGQVNDRLGDVERLADVRQLRIRELLRTQRQLVERDPNGAPILRAEIVAFAPTDAALDSARAAGFSVARERVLDGLDTHVVVLRAPERMSTRRALAQLRGLDPNGAYDYNHIYFDSGVVTGNDAAPRARPTSERAAEVGTREGATKAGVNAREGAPDVGVNAREGATDASVSARVLAGASSHELMLAMAEGSPEVSATEPPRVKLGLVDGGVDAGHPVFLGAAIHQHGCGDKAVPSPHGTAVASLMIGRSELFHGAAPGAELFAADVYCGLGTGGAVDAVVDAIAWIARARVPVINVSLVGPPNTTLENVVKIAVARGFVIVAAVGNDGAAAPPLYPASYPGVIGVTGVDAHEKVLLEACRGPQVDFAAPGADMAAAMLSPGFAAVRGTSFAAPIVAGLLATQLSEPSAAGAEKAFAQLAHAAVDLGARGVDKVYGNGLVGDAVRIAPTVALLGHPADSRVAGK